MSRRLPPHVPGPGRSEPGLCGQDRLCPRPSALIHPSACASWVLLRTQRGSDHQPEQGQRWPCQHLGTLFPPCLPVPVPLLHSIPHLGLCRRRADPAWQVTIQSPHTVLLAHRQCLYPGGGGAGSPSLCTPACGRTLTPRGGACGAPTQPSGHLLLLPGFARAANKIPIRPVAPSWETTSAVPSCCF